MDTTTDIGNIIEKYKTGHRYFINLDFDKGEKLADLSLTETTFENCYFSVDFSNTNFSNSKFIKCNLKCSDFTNCNLTNTTFENCSLESVVFKNAVVQNLTLTNCFCYGQKVHLDNKTNELKSDLSDLVKELYDNVPEFNKIADHSDDELDYMVYGALSIKLFEDITKNNTITEFTTNCFKFFNLIGDRNNDTIDNILVVGIYEGLYANKKCNDIARQLLTGRNKEVYEHWMINGNIRADY